MNCTHKPPAWLLPLPPALRMVVVHTDLCASPFYPQEHDESSGLVRSAHFRL